MNSKAPSKRRLINVLGVFTACEQEKKGEVKKKERSTESTLKKRQQQQKKKKKTDQPVT